MAAPGQTAAPRRIRPGTNAANPRRGHDFRDPLRQGAKPAGRGHDGGATAKSRDSARPPARDSPGFQHPVELVFQQGPPLAQFLLVELVGRLDEGLGPVHRPVHLVIFLEQPGL